MKDYISIKTWEKYQHYHDRNPPWIKLYNAILDDYEYSCLQDDSKLLLISLFLLASKCENKIPADPAWIKKKCNLQGKVNLQLLLDADFITLNGSASTLLAPCKQNGVPETEKRQRKEEKSIFQKKPFPKDYQLTEKHIEYAQSKGIVSGHEDIFEDFSLYHVKMGSKFVDWFAAWQTWIRKKIEFEKQEDDPYSSKAWWDKKQAELIAEDPTYKPKSYQQAIAESEAKNRKRG